MVIVQSFNGAGDSLTPARINLVCFWLIEIPVANMFSLKLGLKENGVYYAILIAETCMTLTAIYIFKRGKWKWKKV